MQIYTGTLRQTPDKGDMFWPLTHYISLQWLSDHPMPSFVHPSTTTRIRYRKCYISGLFDTRIDHEANRHSSNGIGCNYSFLSSLLQSMTLFFKFRKPLLTILEISFEFPMHVSQLLYNDVRFRIVQMDKRSSFLKALCDSITWFPAQLGRLQKYTWNFKKLSHVNVVQTWAI